MITANQFFHDTNAVGVARSKQAPSSSSSPKEHQQSSDDQLLFSRWRRISNASWRLERRSPNNTRVASTQHVHPPQAVLDSMDALLRQHSVSGGGSSHDHVHQDQLVLEMEAYLGNNGNNNIALPQQDRQGVRVSTPLRLTSKTLTQGLLALTERSDDDDDDDDDNPFCMQAMNSTSGVSSTMEFASYANDSSNQQYYRQQYLSSHSGSYVPPGYEDFEALQTDGKSDSNNSTSSNSHKSNNHNKNTAIYYLIEIQTKKEQAEAGQATMILGSGTTLEDVYLILNGGHNNGSANPQDMSNTTVGIKAKLISTQAWVEFLKNDPRTTLDGTQRGDLTWVFDALESMPPLQLPQRLSATKPNNNDNEPSSLLLVVSLDDSNGTNSNSVATNHHFPMALSSPSSSLSLASSVDNNSSNNNNNNSTSKTVTSGNLILKFHRNALIRYSPMESQLSTSHFCITRSVQMIQYASTEQDKVRKALEGALWNAERFIPEYKRIQWDSYSFPDVIISVVPHPALPFILSRWLQNPQSRKSNFDLAASNLLMHLPYWQRYSPRDCPYIDSRWMFHEHIWRDIASARANVEQIVAAVQKSAQYHKEASKRQQQSQQQSQGMDAQDLHEMCRAAELGRNKADAYPCERLRQGYVRRMLAALDIERLHCFEDIKKHDLYSVHWKGHVVEIPPPLCPSRFCPKCHPPSNDGVPLMPRGLHCIYHMASLFYEEEKGKSPPLGKPIAIRTKLQLERLPRLLAMFPGESLIVKLTVPGVAEDFPLISIGDLVRLFFRSPGDELKTEVVGEVVEIVVKSEEVTVRVPSPYQRNTGITMGCFPYLQALLHTNDYVVDARPILASGIPPAIVAIPITDSNRKEMLDRLRFDVRFGYQGFRGFDIISDSLRAFFYTPNIDHLTTVTMKKARKKLCLKRAKADNVEHWARVLTPTKADDAHILRVEQVAELFRPEAPPPLTFITPVNPEQQRAVTDIAFRNHGQAPYILEGPAGTGKSMCVCESILQVLRVHPGAKIMVCAPSDAACDVLASRLLTLKHHKSILRLNWWSRKVESVKPELLSSCPVDVSTGVFTVPSLEHLQRVDVVICQCFVAECLELVGQRGWTRSHFTHLFIDETSQAMECEAFVPISKVGPRCSIILAGDPRQLGPTIRDPIAASMGLGMSILERLSKLPLYASKRYCVNTQLVRNYRSNEALLTVPSSLFYGGSLQCSAPKEVTNPFEDWGDLGPAGFPLLLCNVPHGKERSKVDTPSFYNLEECHAIIALAQGLLRCTCKEGVEQLHTGQISVITPFRAQVLALRLLLRNANLGGVNVGVVEDFQGQEAKVVFISTVLTRDHERWHRSATDKNGEETGQRFGFLHDPKRFNVAITRAHALCIVVGNADYLEKSGTYWSALMDHIKRNDGVLGGGGSASNGAEEDGSNDDDDDTYGVDDLLRRVEELRLLGCGAEEDLHDLSFYYSDVPQWKVMLS